MKKGIIVLMFFTILHVVVYAQSPDDFNITQNKDGFITITGYTGTTKQVVIPATIENIKVTEIGREAFSGKQITSVTIPNSITLIENDAFAYNKLTNITIPNSVKIIGFSAFRNNQLINITIGNGVTDILSSVFQYNELANILIPHNVKNIGQDAFANNKLTSISIPDSVVNINFSTFYDAFEDGPISITIGKDKSYASLLPHNFGAFYTSQNKNAGSYIWTGRLWQTATTAMVQEHQRKVEEQRQQKIAQLKIEQEQREEQERIKREESVFEYYKNGDGFITITKYVGEATELKIPEILGGIKVTKIGERAFYYNKSQLSLHV